MSFAAAIEPLRAANVLTGQTLYDWSLVSADGLETRASNQTCIRLDDTITSTRNFDDLFVCAGGNPALYRNETTFKWLRRMSRAGVRIGGISGGSYILARAGLLRDRRFTIHWEHVAAFREEFPELNVRATLFEIDRDRLSCAGGIASLDLMHAIIENDYGSELAKSVSEWFVQTSVRPGSGAQRMGPVERLGIRNLHLITILKQLEQRFADPLDISALAQSAGISPRHLQRLFAEQLNTTVEQHVFSLRLERSRELIRQSALSIMAISVATGFTSASHFSRRYRAKYGRSPAEERRIKPQIATPVTSTYGKKGRKEGLSSKAHQQKRQHGN